MQRQPAMDRAPVPPFNRTHHLRRRQGRRARRLRAQQHLRYDYWGVAALWLPYFPSYGTLSGGRGAKRMKKGRRHGRRCKKSQRHGRRWRREFRRQRGAVPERGPQLDWLLWEPLKRFTARFFGFCAGLRVSEKRRRQQRPTPAGAPPVTPPSAN